MAIALKAGKHTNARTASRLRRQVRGRKKVVGSAERPRLPLVSEPEGQWDHPAMGPIRSPELPKEKWAQHSHTELWGIEAATQLTIAVTGWPSSWRVLFSF
jgi:hypothetical protein